MVKILGIDEAGRGPVCGPMVMCGFLMDDRKVSELRELKVRDSKLLTHEKREELFPLLKKIADDHVVLKISASEIDALRTDSNLNKLEIAKMQHMINMLNPEVTIIDSPEVNTKAFAKKVAAGVSGNTKIIAENFADKNHVEVGAASIIAKVERDAEIKKLHEKYGYFGSGYPHDEVTIRFLKDWIKLNKEFPDFVRKSWLTANRIKAEKEQTTIKGFAK